MLWKQTENLQIKVKHYFLLWIRAEKMYLRTDEKKVISSPKMYEETKLVIDKF